MIPYTWLEASDLVDWYQEDIDSDDPVDNVEQQTEGANSFTVTRASGFRFTVTVTEA